MKTIVASQRAVSSAMSRLVAAKMAGAPGSSLPFWSLAILLFVLASACPADLLFPTEAIIALRTSPSVPAAFTLEPGNPITVVAAVMTNHDAKGYETLAVEKARHATTGEVVRLQAEHREWWQSFWAESYVELEDKLLEKHYYASHYVMACCSRNPKFPPGLYGNWITLDRTAWSGDIHLNYNHQAPFWALYSSNHIGLTECYDAPLLEQLEGFQRDARTFLNKKGAYASVGIGPKGLICRFPASSSELRTHNQPPL